VGCGPCGRRFRVFRPTKEPRGAQAEPIPHITVIKEACDRLDEVKRALQQQLEESPIELVVRQITISELHWHVDIHATTAARWHQFRGQEAAMSTIRPVLPREIDVLNAIDDDATLLYAQCGMPIELPHDHVFVRSELARWLRSAELGRAFLAIDDSGAGVGFAALDVVDGEPYIDQLAVRVAAQRQGIGGRLLAHSADWARALGGSAIWLTTYDHVAFNRAYYEHRGYVVVPENGCGPGIRRHLEEQRQYLPAPAHRVAMRRSL